MNKQIQKLAVDAGLKIESLMTNPPKPFQILGSTDQFEKFAELIVRECIDIIRPCGCGCDDATKELQYDLMNQIKSHFGVTK